MSNLTHKKKKKKIEAQMEKRCTWTMFYMVKQKLEKWNWWKTRKQQNRLKNGHHNQALCHEKYLTMI